MVAMAAASLIGCRPGTGSLQVQARLSALRSDVARVEVQISNSAGYNSLINLSNPGGTFQGVFENLAPGNYVLLGQAFDINNAVIYQGTANTSVAAGANATVMLLLQQVSTPVYMNSPPVIDSVVVSRNPVAVNGTVDLSVTAHDPNGLPLSYTWGASAGAYSNATTSTATWTAPESAQTDALTITVSNTAGRTASVTAIVNVVDSAADASIGVVVSFNDAPTITSLTPGGTYVPPGASIDFQIFAADADGDSMTSHWSANCLASWPFTPDRALAANGQISNRFVVDGNAPSPSDCTVSVALTDSRGATSLGMSIVHIGVAPQPNYYPNITWVNQSVVVGKPGDDVTLWVTAAAINAGSIRFDFGETGVADFFHTTVPAGTTATVQWRVPACAAGVQTHALYVNAWAINPNGTFGPSTANYVPIAVNCP